MRFRRLSLERFGRFEGCDLVFRSGSPDLHVIYGANEAGKTTSMAAVSDLLFGFEPRSRYNFLFDYPLLRIGAELEEDERAIEVRRRKANSGSLIDAEDKVIDEGPLAAMLHGQSREGFRLAFSLDHLRLREGGRAIVQARDDVGQALFAAGSGMTGVIAALKAIDEEADAIWGPRAAQRRTFTQAARTYEDARTATRDAQIKPKAWSDARDALAAADAARIGAESERDALVDEQRRLERLRRIGPAMRRRAELLASLADARDAPVLPPAREERILGALDAMVIAERSRAAAVALLGEVDDRVTALAGDPAILAEAEAIDALAERRGAISKGKIDTERLTVEHRAKESRITELRRDVGMSSQELPPRLIIARLRDLTRAHGEAVAALRSIEQGQDDQRARLASLEQRLADAELTPGLADLVIAVDAARRLGDGVDGRCAAAAASAEAATRNATVLRERLAPWIGDADALARVAGIAEPELEAAEADLQGLRNDVRAAAEEERRLAENSARLALDREALVSGGQAVSAAELNDARQFRQSRWETVRDALGSGATTRDALSDADAYERAVVQVDDLYDRRFAFAEGSARLAVLDQQAASLELRRGQAQARREGAEAAEIRTLARWHSRAAETNLPALEPARLRAWLADRIAALEAEAESARLREQAQAEAAGRRFAREPLLALMPGWSAGDETLSPVLREAERRRALGEAQDAAYRADHAEVRQLSEALATQARQARWREEERDRAEQDWVAAIAPLGLALTIVEGNIQLALIDELRVAADEAAALFDRLQGIAADRDRFAADLGALWNSLGQSGPPSLDGLRTRLTTARATASTRAELLSERARRAGEVETAQAARDAAIASLTPHLADLGGIAIDALDAVVQTSRRLHSEREALAAAEAEAIREGEGHALATLEEQWRDTDPDVVAARSDALGPLLAEANKRVAATAETAGDARRAFAALDTPGDDAAAAAAAADAEQARAEMAAQAEIYLLKRAQAVTLRWAIERYRRERQDPMLARAGTLFNRLTLGRYSELRIDYDAAVPRLLGVRDGGQRAIDVEAMSDGTADQLFLALRLAAAEQSVAAGVRLPFLADDLFINFDDDRSRAGFEVLAELARTTQVLFFTHHAHLAAIAGDVVGSELHSECRL